MSDSIHIRQLELDDIPKILEIYNLITGGDGPGEEELEARIDYGDNVLCLGADFEGSLIGFIFGSSEMGSFGETDKTGIIGLLGVHPSYRKKNIGRKLGSELLAQLQGLGISKIRTQIDNNDTELMKFFMNLGFKPSNWTMLELNLS